MANRTIKFEIVTPERIVLKEMVIQVTVPTSDGEITVLPGHIPLVASLQPGVVEIRNEKNEIEIMSLSGGFIEVLKDKIVILADTAERADEIDLDKANEARKRAEDLKKDLRHFDQEEFAIISGQIAKELARTKAKNKWKKLKNLQ